MENGWLVFDYGVSGESTIFFSAVPLPCGGGVKATTDTVQWLKRLKHKNTALFDALDWAGAPAALLGHFFLKDPSKGQLNPPMAPIESPLIIIEETNKDPLPGIIPSNSVLMHRAQTISWQPIQQYQVLVTWPFLDRQMLVDAKHTLAKSLVQRK